MGLRRSGKTALFREMKRRVLIAAVLVILGPDFRWSFDSQRSWNGWNCMGSLIGYATQWKPEAWGSVGVGIFTGAESSLAWGGVAPRQRTGITCSSGLVAMIG